MLHTKEDLERMREKVAEQQEPWKSGYAIFAADPQSSADWKVRGGFEVVIRDPKINLHNEDLARDANAAYQNALMWSITGEQAHAEKAVTILNAWSGTLKRIEGHDKELAAGLYGFKYLNAAEILRYTYSGWKPADRERFTQMVRTVFYPVVQNFATFANGNWDGACLKTMIAIGVFLEDRAIFDRAVDYYRNGSGNGRITHYVVNAEGQCQESGRDQQHTQLGLACLAECAEVAWNQGIDLYGESDNRLLRGFEYTAKYNIGEDVPFGIYTDKTGKYKWNVISTEGRGRFRPVFEMIWNHYHNRRGLEAPYTQKVVEKIRPEGVAFQADHPGFGTLLFSSPRKKPGTK